MIGGQEAGIQQSPDTQVVVEDVSGLNLFPMLCGPIALLIVLGFRFHHLDDRIGPVLGLPGRACAVGFFSMLVGSSLAVMFLGFFMPAPGDSDSGVRLADLAMMLVASYVGQAIVIGLLMAWASGHRLPGDELRAQLGPGMAITWAIRGLVLGWPMVITVSWIASVLQEVFLSIQPQEIAHSALQSIAEDPGTIWKYLVIVIVVLLTPIFEEFMYRGLLQQGLAGAGIGRWPAIIVASIIFALMHLPALSMESALSAVLTLFALGLVLGFLYERTGRLLAPIIMHGLFNLGNILLIDSPV